MGALEGIDSRQRFELPATCLIGRGSGCSLRSTGRRVSSEHARIAWTGERWELRDLGSRNGTFVAGARLQPGHVHALAPGDALGFGQAEASWTFVDAGAPRTLARSLRSGESVEAVDGLLALPSSERALVCIFAGSHGQWQVETETETRAVADREVIIVEGQPWELHLPVPHEPTIEAGDLAPELGSVALTFTVSLDEEDVHMLACHGEETLSSGARSHHHLLLLLARALLEDGANPELPESEQGWRYVEEVCRQLQIDDLRLNTEIYRARKELARSVTGAARLVERRRASRSLRLGTRRVTVKSG